ncbi:hypothetical protein BDBG_05717 [Blastomyces gilchristii SLH14081]|uniref:Uncharacterized protein n=1 Tax=Blastomyces gilchristii (strain SLH14081) TaxID=559298 RepID=A0A179UPM8_BLAGS|nr:uncharacterized protein BDBG_05717 [Blastomyces gilchristii SLH14081]OAT10035.1 hypothetical protein BDBG_05717 [Blastomyces gilchristii SLH14081]
MGYRRHFHIMVHGMAWHGMGGNVLRMGGGMTLSLKLANEAARGLRTRER